MANRVLIYISSVSVGILTLTLVAIYVWPTRYSFDQMRLGDNTVPVRIDRFSGKTEFLTPYGWKPAQPNVSTPPPTPTTDNDETVLALLQIQEVAGRLPKDVLNDPAAIDSFYREMDRFSRAKGRSLTQDEKVAFAATYRSSHR